METLRRAQTTVASESPGRRPQFFKLTPPTGVKYRLLFRLEPLRFSFLAREPIHFPAGKSSNILRGAFGVIFRR